MPSLWNRIALVMTIFIIIMNFNICDALHNHRQNLDWWETSVLYQIYPRSFKDSDGDGIGDIRGIISKLEYLKDTGIKAVWLSPIFQSPMVDFGYDISNFTQIHNEYGTMEDFDDLLTEAKRLGIRIILDFVPNHTSDQCEWFLKSVNREDGYDDFYIWHDGVVDEDGNRRPPNNWQSVFYGPAWSWNEQRKQFYLHQFASAQPDLNYRNSKVVKEMENILKFWLDKGVTGFRVDAVNHIFEVEDLRDEPLTGLDRDPNSYAYTHHYYTKDLPESNNLIYNWRELLEKYKESNGGETRIMLTEAYANITATMEYYENAEGRKGSHIPFNFLLITDLDRNSDARDIVFSIQKWKSYMPIKATPNWVLGNHDQPRIASRFGEERIDAMNMLLLTLPGVAITYNGEEIGMTDNYDITWEQTKDPPALNTNPEVFQKFTRDPGRTPFQWDNSVNAGFSNGSSTWLPINSNYVEINLHAQMSAARSHYKFYKRLVHLRNHPTMQKGSFQPLAVNRKVLAYKRVLHDNDMFIGVINIGGDQETINLKDIWIMLEDTLYVVAAGSKSLYTEGFTVSSSQIKLKPYDCVLFRATYKQFKILNNGILPYASQILNMALLGIFVYGIWRHSSGSSKISHF